MHIIKDPIEAVEVKVLTVPNTLRTNSLECDT